MKESISYTFLLNIMIIFIVIAFFIIMGIIGYTKAFRVNSKIANAIERHEGYNKLATDEINKIITSYGYQNVRTNCPSKKGAVLVSDASAGYCVYLFDVQGQYFYSYGITTYMSFDFPIVSTFARIPVYTKTEKIYKLG